MFNWKVLLFLVFTVLETIQAKTPIGTSEIPMANGTESNITEILDKNLKSTGEINGFIKELNNIKSLVNQTFHTVSITTTKIKHWKAINSLKNHIDELKNVKSLLNQTFHAVSIFEQHLVQSKELKEKPMFMSVGKFIHWNFVSFFLGVLTFAIFCLIFGICHSTRENKKISGFGRLNEDTDVGTNANVTWEHNNRVVIGGNDQGSGSM